MNIWKWLVGFFTGKPSKALEDELARKYFTPLVVWDEPQQEYVAVLGLFNATGHGDTDEAAIEDMYAKIMEAMVRLDEHPRHMGCLKTAVLSGVGTRKLSSMTDEERNDYSNAHFNVHCGMGAKDHFAITKWFAERGFNVWGD
jgi:hypothetical protein